MSVPEKHGPHFLNPPLDPPLNPPLDPPMGTDGPVHPLVGPGEPGASEAGWIQCCQGWIQGTQGQGSGSRGHRGSVVDPGDTGAGQWIQGTQGHEYKGPRGSDPLHLRKKLDAHPQFYTPGENYFKFWLQCRLCQVGSVSECQNAPVVKSVQCIFDSDDRPSGKCPV